MSTAIPYMCNDTEMSISSSDVSDDLITSPKLVAMDCEMVGGGNDGTLPLCGRVCLVNENEEVIFHSYVRPILDITNYRYPCSVNQMAHCSFRNLL